MTTSGVVTTGPATSPSVIGGDVAGRQIMSGQVTAVDHSKGTFALHTAQMGTMYFYAPPASLAGMKPGDTVAVEIAAAPIR